VDLAVNTFFAALFNDGVVSFLFRGRDSYINAIYPQLADHDLNFIFLLFGSGEFYMRAISVAPLMLEAGMGTTFEMDIFDILGSFGVIGSFLYSLLVYIFVRAIKPRGFLFETKLALFLLSVHAFMAGHVLFSPQVTTILAFILILHGQSSSAASKSSTVLNKGDATP
jgi:hypothetical protein